MNKGKLTGTKATAYALDKKGENGYNEIGGSKNGKTATEETAGATIAVQSIISEDGDNSGRGGISFFNDVRGIRRISEISRRKKIVEKVKTFASTIYYNAENEQQADFQALAKDEGIKLYFAKRSPNTQYEYIFDDEMLIIDENMTREQLGEVLRVEKPVGENGTLNKIVFTDGKYNSYSICTVIKINLDNQADLSIERSRIYANERKGVYKETNELVKVYYAKDFKFSYK